MGGAKYDISDTLNESSVLFEYPVFSSRIIYIIDYLILKTLAVLKRKFWQKKKKKYVFPDP